MRLSKKKEKVCSDSVEETSVSTGEVLDPMPTGGNKQQSTEAIKQYLNTNKTVLKLVGWEFAHA